MSILDTQDSAPGIRQIPVVASHALPRLAAAHRILRLARRYSTENNEKVRGLQINSRTFDQGNEAQGQSGPQASNQQRQAKFSRGLIETFVEGREA